MVRYPTCVSTRCFLIFTFHAQWDQGSLLYSGLNVSRLNCEEGKINKDIIFGYTCLLTVILKAETRNAMKVLGYFSYN